MRSERSNHQDVLDQFAVFQGATQGIDRWLSSETPTWVLDTLCEIDSAPLTLDHLNQLLTVVNQQVSEGFFRFYWLEKPIDHSYEYSVSVTFDEGWLNGSDLVCSLDHLYWGLYRFYTDALLYYGNISLAFRTLNSKSLDELRSYFESERFNTTHLLDRTIPIQPTKISKDNRYLISEMACKSYTTENIPVGELETELLSLYDTHMELSGGPTTPKKLLDRAYDEGHLKDRQMQMDLSVDDFQNVEIHSQEQLKDRIRQVSRTFEKTRAIALANTGKYLSIVNDLDVYVATSMRNRDDFRKMADFCESVFGHLKLSDLRLRYFDPTLSAASHHEDKGLLECLMVKCAKVLILHAGDKDSFGKDAEAAMALSLGKPVIIYSSEEYRSRFFRDIHPLARLINVATGVANGAMVATSESQVVELLRRIFYNKLQYIVDQKHDQFLILKESLTNSIVRLQTSDLVLHDTFWKYYGTSDS